MRSLFPRLYINEATCAQGIKSIQHYQFGVNKETGQRSPEPLHNWASHAASSISDYAVMLKEGNKPQTEEVERERSHEGALGWMG
jgi:phage terminase large subunit